MKLLASDPTPFYEVAVSASDVADFNSKWPCSNIPEKRIVFTFARNGDLVDIRPDLTRFDGDALLALSQDAQAYGQSKLKH